MTKYRRRKVWNYKWDKYWERVGCKYFWLCSQQLAPTWGARHSLTQCNSANAQKCNTDNATHGVRYCNAKVCNASQISWNTMQYNAINCKCNTIWIECIALVWAPTWGVCQSVGSIECGQQSYIPFHLTHFNWCTSPVFHTIQLLESPISPTTPTTSQKA